jgi:C-terminal processing protease CtpA/Prc
MGSARTGLASAAVVLIGILSLGMGTEARTLERVQIERLASLCRLWGSAKVFHPYLAYRDVDWDAALVRAIPKVQAAQSTAEYSAAIQSMLDALGDPATHVVLEPPPPPPAAKNEADPRWEWAGDKTLVVTVHDYADLMDFEGASSKLQAVGRELPKARALLFDLRSAAPVAGDQVGMLSFVFDLSGLPNALTAIPLVGPGQRFRMHVGFAPAEGATSGDYYSAFTVRDGQRFPAGTSAQERPVGFLINRWSELPAIALALQAAGKALLAAEGEVTDAAFAGTYRVRLAGGVKARLRSGELVHADGSTGLRIDAQVSAAHAKEEALALLDHPASGKPAGATPSARGAPQADKAYADMTYPSSAYRLLAVFRIWTIGRYFFPYTDLIGEDWDGVLQQFIPRAEEARDAREYALTVAEMATHLHDSHVTVRGGALAEIFGTSSPPLLIRMIEGVPVVVGFLDRNAAKGVSIGDEILEVDGEDARARFGRYARYTPASTPQGLNRSVQRSFLNGPEGSRVTLTVRDGAGRKRTVSLPRKAAFWKTFEGWRAGDIVRILPGNIGYADLERLQQPEVDAMFEKLRETKAIIFDMRGYPRGTAWSIAPRLTEREAVPAARIDRPVVLEPEDEEGGNRSQAAATDSFLQPIPRTDKWRYRGRTVMLIDERTISRAEHSGLFFEAANGTKFIGSPTVGANGDVTNFVVPGGIRITFTGLSVRHADGRQLQRIGLVPDVAVAPTLAGIRAEKDEVLEKAVEFLQAPASRPAR